MLVIRDEQLKVFERDRRGDFEQRLAAHLGRLNAARGWGFSESDLAEQVKRGVASGLRFFQRERDVARYCEVVLDRLGGWHGEDHPADALSMLGSNSSPPARRIEYFERWVNRRKGPPRAR